MIKMKHELPFPHQRHVHTPLDWNDLDDRRDDEMASTYRTTPVCVGAET